MEILLSTAPSRTFDEVCGKEGAFATFTEKKHNAIAKMARDVDARIRASVAADESWTGVQPRKCNGLSDDLAKDGTDCVIAAAA